MKVTLLDTKTGERRDCHDDYCVSWWTDGNGSCDCNRALAFGGPCLLQKQRIALGLPQDVCIGARRWLVVDVSGDLEGMTRAQVIDSANDGY